MCRPSDTIVNYTGSGLLEYQTILVIGDFDAHRPTLGLVRYLGRRIGATGSTLIMTYRPEEVDLTHPLRPGLARSNRSVRDIVPAGLCASRFVTAPGRIQPFGWCKDIGVATSNSVRLTQHAVGKCRR